MTLSSATPPNPALDPIDTLTVNLTAETDWSLLLQQLLDRRSLEVEQAATLMQGWLAEAIPPALSGAILAAIQANGVSASELAGMAQVLQSQSLGCNFQSSQSELPSPLIDTCGTGRRSRFDVQYFHGNGICSGGSGCSSSKARQSSCL